MSNIIKSKHVYVNLNDAKIINSDEKLNEIFMVNMSNNSFQNGNDEYAATDEGAFREGLNATTINTVYDEAEENNQENINVEYGNILDNARNEAEQIIEQAKLDSKKVCDLLYAEAKKQGYEDGMVKAAAEVDEMKKDLENQALKLQDDYQAEINRLEPEFGNILIDLIRKITGVVIEDKKDIISYLIYNAISHADNSQNYMIKVSKADYDLVLSKKEELLELVDGESVVIDISMDRKLDKNQCIIETDSRIIDCSLDVQIKGLIQDIKLLSIQSGKNSPAF